MKNDSKVRAIFLIRIYNGCTLNKIVTIENIDLKYRFDSGPDSGAIQTDCRNMDG